MLRPRAIRRQRMSAERRTLSAMAKKEAEMLNESCGSWLSDQVIASAHRLTNRPPSLLSPTARILKADIAAWIEAASVACSQHEGPTLRVVHHSAETEPLTGQQQLTILTEIPKSPRK